MGGGGGGGEGFWKFVLLGQACFHLGRLEDALLLLQRAKWHCRVTARSACLCCSTLRRQSLQEASGSFCGGVSLLVTCCSGWCRLQECWAGDGWKGRRIWAGGVGRVWGWGWGCHQPSHNADQVFGPEGGGWGGSIQGGAALRSSASVHKRYVRSDRCLCTPDLSASWHASIPRSFGVQKGNAARSRVFGLPSPGGCF